MLILVATFLLVCYTHFAESPDIPMQTGPGYGANHSNTEIKTCTASFASTRTDSRRIASANRRARIAPLFPAPKR
jgi:hypothetical protein